MGDVQTGQPDSTSQRRRPPAGTSAAGVTVPADWRRWFDQQRQRVDTEISKHLNIVKRQVPPHSRLLESVEYSLASGGKRFRPILVLETCRVCGGAEEAAWPAALAVECVHTFSLIHDDLPAMDNDDLRRGNPTSHKVFGEALAILAGDWLFAHAFVLLTSQRLDPGVTPQLVQTLAEGSRDIIVGQAADIAGEQRQTDPRLVQFIHQYKTARLLEACCKLGALSAGAAAADRNLMTTYGRHLGLAFQIVDDLLDRTGRTSALGKRAGKDVDESKQTYPAAFGIGESRRRARGEVEAAVATLEPFGPRADRLRNLAWYVIVRDR